MSKPKQRTSVTLDADVLAFAEGEVAAGRARSVSAVVEEALRAQMTRRARIRTWLDRELSAAQTRDPAGYAESRQRIAALFDVELPSGARGAGPTGARRAGVTADTGRADTGRADTGRADTGRADTGSRSA